MTYTTNLWNRTPSGFELQEKELGGMFSPSMVTRGRASNVALTSVMEKTVAFLPSSVGFRASSIASDFGATYVDVEDLQVTTLDGKYHDKLSSLMADQPDDIDELHVARLAVTAKVIRPGSLTDRIDRVSGMVPFTVARERSDNPVLVWNDQYDRADYPGISAKALKAAVEGQATAVNFMDAGTEDSGQAPEPSGELQEPVDYKLRVTVADMPFEIPTTADMYEYVLRRMKRKSRHLKAKGLRGYDIEIETGSYKRGGSWSTLIVREA